MITKTYVNIERKRKEYTISNLAKGDKFMFLSNPKDVFMITSSHLTIASCINISTGRELELALTQIIEPVNITITASKI